MSNQNNYHISYYMFLVHLLLLLEGVIQEEEEGKEVIEMNESKDITEDIEFELVN